MHLGKLCILAGSLAVSAALLSSLPNCSNQGEGERCDLANGNEDCGDGLVCTSKQDLQTSSDICCPPEGVEPTDLACVPGSLADAGVGGSTGGTGGAGATGGSSTGGAGGAGGSTGGAGGSAGAGGAGGSGGSSTGGAGGAGGAGTAGAGGG